MQRAEAEKVVRHLCHVWRKSSGNDQTAPDQLGSTEFMAWLRNNHSECMNFHSRAGVTYDIDLWFDQEFKQAWSR